MEYNYLIKYAIMPYNECVGFVSGTNKKIHDVTGYIVSKCYVLDINIHIYYEEGGSLEKESKVVFPYQKKEEWKRVYPNPNATYINSTTVYNLYDCFEDAKKAAKKLNDEILNKNKINAHVSDKYQEDLERIEFKHQCSLNNIEIIEKYIEKNTPDMVVPHIPKKCIIAVLKDQDKILPMTIYDFINQYRYEHFYVCNVTEDDFEIMKKQIKTRCLDERIPTKIESAYDRFRYLLANDIENEMIRIANCDSENVNGAYYIDSNNTLCYDEKMHPFHEDSTSYSCACGIKVYTTENFQDILNTYRNISMETLEQGMVPKRALK